MIESWRYQCNNCGSTSLRKRVSKGGYYCRVCYNTMQDGERVDKKRGELCQS